VKPGDSLSRIASANKTTTAAIKKANNLTSDRINVGQKLKMPGAATSASADGDFSANALKDKPALDAEIPVPDPIGPGTVKDQPATPPSATAVKTPVGDPSFGD
jgi:murein DD-endopeptidase MepM/ murein hydrolase activator NlpD